jgi:uncharacterized protein
MSSIDQQFIEYIVKSLVGKPEAVKVERRIDEKGVLLELSVDPEDLGRVIGKRGATAQSLRTLLRALGTKNDARYNLKIIDTGPPPQRDATAIADESAADEKPEDAAPDNATADDTDETVLADDQVAHPDDADDERDDTSHSSVISKTRQELAELDDLDV